MKVKEMIELLQQYDGERECEIYDSARDEFRDVRTIKDPGDGFPLEIAAGVVL